MKVYRLVRERYLSDPLNAEGAAKTGGRWNNTGIAMLYTSESPATANLEILAGVNERSTLSQFHLVHIEIPDELLDPALEVTIEVLEEIQKNVGSSSPWDEPVRPAFTADIGDTWFESQASLALKVPSSLSPIDFNVLINTTHPDFDKIKVVKIDGEGINPRLLPQKDK